MRTSALFPHTSVSGLEYYGQSDRCGKTARDFLCFVPRAPSRLVMVIGDVVPAGVAAGIVMAAMETSLRMLVRHDARLDVLASELNRTVWHLAPGNICANLLCIQVDSGKAASAT